MEPCFTHKPLKLQLLDYDGALSELKGAWRQLHRDAAAPPFLRWEWMSLWWDIYRARGDRLHLIAIRAGGDLVALAPFYLQQEQGDCLRFLSTGEAEREEVCSEYLDLLIRPGLESACLELIAEYLLSSGRRWQWMRFDRVLPDAHIAQLVRRLGRRCAVLDDPMGWRYRIELPQRYDDWLQQLSSSMRGKLRRCERKLSLTGGYRADAPRGADDAERMLDELSRLHAVRWSRRDQPGVFAAPRFYAFHRQYSRLQALDESLQLRLYSVDGQPIAGFYGLRDHGTTHYYQSGFDIERYGRLSPLFMVHCREIATAIERGDRYYDFMRSPRKSYKMRYGCCETPMHSYSVAPRGSASIAFGLRRARRWLKRQHLSASIG